MTIATVNIKSVYKFEIAAILGVSCNTFRKYMNNEMVLNKLYAYNYRKTQKIIYPNQLKVICDHFGIELKDFV